MSIHLTPQACSTAHNSQNRCWRLWRILSVACLGKLQARRIRTDVCTRSLPLAQERDLLEQALRQARNACNRQAEHQALLLLRRLARRYEDDELVLQCNQQLCEWWRRQRQLVIGGSQP